MVSTGALTGIVIELVLSVGFPVGLIIYFSRKHWISWKAVGIGAFVFIFFSQVLEKILHIQMLASDGSAALKWSASPLLFVLYAGLSAGIFEEVGRYIGFRWLLKNRESYGDGLSLGVGHGGVEALLIGGLAALNALVIANQINQGTLADTLGSSLSAAQIESIKDQFTHVGFWSYALAGIERVVAVTFHMLASLIVLLAVRKKAIQYLIYAILLHAVFDFVPAMYQAKIITSLWIVEGIIVILGILSVFGIMKMKKVYTGE